MKNRHTKYNRLMFLRIALFQILMISSMRLSAQVYNYDPIRHTNFETNPSFLASDKNNFTAGIVHHGDFYSSNKFYYDALNVSLYNQKYCTGIGLIVSNAHVADSTDYNYIGIGSAHRTIFFNAIYARIGFLYKLINVKSPPGVFNYYSFDRHYAGDTKRTFIENANVSIALSSAQEKYYLSTGFLNVQLPFQSNETYSVFDRSFFLNVGDFAKILRLKSWEISYSGFIKKGKQRSALMSHYINIFYNGFKLSRTSGLRYGANIGAADNAYIQCVPSIIYYRKMARRNYISCQLLYNIGFYTSGKLPYHPTNQFNITYLF